MSPLFDYDGFPKDLDYALMMSKLYPNERWYVWTDDDQWLSVGPKEVIAYYEKKMMKEITDDCDCGPKRNNSI